MGGRYSEIWPQRGDFTGDVGGADMVPCQGIRVPKRRACGALHWKGIDVGIEGH